MPQEEDVTDGEGEQVARWRFRRADSDSCGEAALFSDWAKDENGSTSVASPSRAPTAIENVDTMTVSEPEAAWASCGLYSWPSKAGWISVIAEMDAANSSNSRLTRWSVMVVSIAVIGRLGCSALPEPPSMWSTIVIAMSRG
jgi:hypothetical protein